MPKRNELVAVVVLWFLLIPAGAVPARACEQRPTTAAGKPAEGDLQGFQGAPFFQKQVLYSGGRRVRGPNITVAIDGTILARGDLRDTSPPGRGGRLRRSEDGGESWSDPQEVPFRTMIVDENSGDVLAVQLSHGDRLWRSRDHGQTWKEDQTTVKPNQVMKWLEQTGLATRGTQEGSQTDAPKYYLHVGAAESGITLRHGKTRGGC